MQTSTENSRCPKVNKPQYMRIVYRDWTDKIRDAIIQLPEDECFEGVSYKENVDRSIAIINDEGGFWLNDTTAIPFHRILSFHTHQEKEKENKFIQGRNRRRGNTYKGKNNANVVSANNGIPQNQDSTGKVN